ncbi:hypothetical protein CpPA04_1747 [Corynebacterium pseudotuberculosis]|nr:hypothetical protein CpPA04_1747 [Corynebacterium pseudotuberculosis]ATQ66067.1 Hypothetical protein CpPA07_1775 [Corynebacterium pseudotuberculosis]
MGVHYPLRDCQDCRAGFCGIDTAWCHEFKHIWWRREAKWVHLGAFVIYSARRTFSISPKVQTIELFCSFVDLEG